MKTTASNNVTVASNVATEKKVKKSKLPRRTNAAILPGGNTKLGKTMGTFSKLKGDKDYYVPELDVIVKGSCGRFCKGCEKACYVEKSYVRHTNRETGECSVILGHAINTLAFYNDIDKAFIDMHEQLNRKRKKFVYVRIDQSGELISAYEYEKWSWLSEQHPETIFYVYSKAFEYMTDYLLAGNVPKNLVTLFSVWHESGIQEYKAVAHLVNVKAFVYMDKNKDPENGWGLEEYKAHGLDVQTMCAAYDLKGKMNHDITCDKCKKCMNKLMNCKVIGCWSH